MNGSEKASWPMNDDDIRRVMKTMKTVAVVGISKKEERASNGVAQWLVKQGFDVVGVNPVLKEAAGCKVYPSLEDVPGHVDVVDVFRNADYVAPIIDSAIAIGAGAVWLQEGIVHIEAGEKARKAGLDVIMDRCIFKEWLRLCND